MGVGPEDFTALGWAMLVSQESHGEYVVLVAALDQQLSPLQMGRAAAAQGAVRGENPFACPTGRAQWEAGWLCATAAQRQRAKRCGLPVFTLGLPL